MKEKVVKEVDVDPHKKMHDIDTSNNQWPVREMPAKFEIFKANKKVKVLNPVQRALKKGHKP